MSARHHRLEGFQSGFADVVFDPFTVHRRGCLADTDSQQKRPHDLVAIACLGRHPFALSRQRDGLIGLGHHQSVALQAADRVADRRVRHVKVSNQINGSADPIFRDGFGDGLDIIFGHFAGVVGSSAMMRLGRQIAAL